MRFIVGIIIAGLLVWCGWWFVGSSAQKTAWTNWFDDRKNAGWVAETADITLRGFPNRFDTTLSQIELADPSSGWAWSAPFFQVLMLSYKPNHVIAVWPDSQKISSPHDTATITSDTMRGSVIFLPDSDLTLDSTQIEIKSMGLIGTNWSAGLESANFATRRVEAGDAPDFAHQIGFDAMNLTLSDSLKRSLDPASILPGNMERAHFDIIAAFDAPWDRHSIEGTKPQLTAISVKDIDITWGKLNLRAKGLLNVDAQGFPNGDLNVTAKNWQEILNLAVRSGIISRDIAETAKGGLNLLSQLSGDRTTLNIPLSFGNGLIRLGPIPIGAAPRLHIR